MAAEQTPEAFFDELRQRRYEPLLRRETGTLRWDVQTPSGLEHWFVEVNRGDLSVTNANKPADAVLRCDRELLEGLVTGRINAMAALMRGVLDAEGNLTLALEFQRLLPGPPQLGETKSTAKVDA